MAQAKERRREAAAARRNRGPKPAEGHPAQRDGRARALASTCSARTKHSEALKPDSMPTAGRWLANDATPGTFAELVADGTDRYVAQQWCAAPAPPLSETAARAAARANRFGHREHCCAAG